MYMKKFIIASILIVMGILSVSFGQMVVPDSQNYILNESDQQVLNTQGISDPLRDGAYNMIQPDNGTGTVGVLWADEAKITSYQNAQTRTMGIIKKALNYLLWSLSLIALIYLIYHGFLILTAAGDDAQYKKWLSGIKYAAIAISGIGASWLIVSIIFWLINLIIWV